MFLSLPPGFWLDLARLGIIFLTAFLAWATYRSNLLLKEFKPDFNLLLSPPELFFRLLLGGVCLFLAWLSGLPARQLGLVSGHPLQAIGWGLGLGLVIVVVVNLLVGWVVSRLGQHLYSPLVIQNIMPERPLEWVLVPLALLPAVAMEELLFRTLWLGGFRGTMPLGVLILGTSVLFGLMHQPQGQLGMVIAGGINILFCLLFIWGGGLLLPLTAHYVVNLLQIIAAHLWMGELWMPEEAAPNGD